MSLKPFLLLLLVLGICAGAADRASGQVTQSRDANADSIRRARQAEIDAQRIARQHAIDSAKASRLRISDSMKAERLRVADSMKAARKHFSDSVQQVRQHRTDSLARIRAYRESRHYRDSVTRSREEQINARKAVQQARFDSLRASRKRITDSIVAVRKAQTDSLRAAQKKRADSLAAIRKYKESKRYRDSVNIVRQGRMDSLRLVRERYNDSARASRKQIADSMAAARQHIRDSTMAARKQYTDSIAVVRKARADSLAKVKEQRLRDQKTMEKNREKRMQLALELKIKKKREAWSNEKMLKKKWSAPRRAVQNTFTRYNYFFNAGNKMDEALKNMQRMQKDNYDSLLALFPFDPDRDSTVLAPDMDSIIQKASVGIQIHDPRTKWGDDLYLLMGQAYYYKGDYKNAAITFRYIVSMRQMLEKNKKKKNRSSRKTSDKAPSIASDDKKNILSFLKHRTAHNEGLLWLTRTYSQSRQPERAESVLELLAADPKFPEHLRGRLALEKAYLALREHNHQTAAKELAIVAEDGHLPDWVRLRAAYINGQLLERDHDYLAAAARFRQVIDMHPAIEMDFYSRKNLAYNLMYAGGDQQEAADALKRMLRDGKYLPYYEQIYFVLGRLSINNGNTADALAYLQKSIETPKSTRQQKAVSFALLGNVHYSLGNYQPAKTAYDSAAYFSGGSGDSLVELAVRRSRSLDGITAPLEVIRVQDSLLYLAALSEKDRLQIVRRYIRKLEQERNDSIFRAQNITVGTTNDPQPRDNSGLANWYFANPMLMQQGMNEFKRKWGNRQLVDNWRRSSAAGFAIAAGNSVPGADEDEETAAGLDENGLPTEESLLAAIPLSPERQEESQELIRRAYVDAANAYVRELEDYPPALSLLDTLDLRYPGHGYKAEVLYLRYLIALRQDRLDAAGEYSTRLLNEYPGSPFALLVKPTEDAVSGGTGNIAVAEFYETTYELFLRRQFTETIQRTAQGKRQYNDPGYNSRFTVLQASALAGAARWDEADTAISVFIRTNPADTLLSWAEAVRNYIRQNRPEIPVSVPDTLTPPAGQLPSGGDTLSGGLPLPPADSLRKPALDTAGSRGAQNPPVNYVYNPGGAHFFLFYFPQMETRIMAVRAALNDLNNLEYSGKALSIKLELLRQQEGILIVQPFKNAVEAKNYISKLKGKPELFRDFRQGDYQMLMISEPNYQKLMADKNMDAYLKFYKSRYK